MKALTITAAAVAGVVATGYAIAAWILMREKALDRVATCHDCLTYVSPDGES